MKKNNFSTMRQMILDFPSQFKVGLEAAKGLRIKGKFDPSPLTKGEGFDNVVVSGMGGSAWPTDVLLSWIPAISNKIFINRTYNLPQWADKKTLFIFSSYSGNTEETISSYNEAIKKGFTSIAIASGGELKELSLENKKHLISIPAGFPPRLATGYIFSALVSILSQAKIIEDKSEEILRMAVGLEPKKLEKKGKKIAEKLFRKIPIIYTSDRFKSLGYVWKAKLNENSKVPVFINYFSELNHNEISGWERPLGKFFVIILRDLNDHPQMAKRIKFTRDFLRAKKIESEVIDINPHTKSFGAGVNPIRCLLSNGVKGESDFSRIFNTILLGDWVSYYLALNYRIDPMSLEVVERLKKVLGDKFR